MFYDPQTRNNCVEYAYYTKWQILTLQICRRWPTFPMTLPITNKLKNKSKTLLFLKNYGWSVIVLCGEWCRYVLSRLLKLQSNFHTWEIHTRFSSKAAWFSCYIPQYAVTHQCNSSEISVYHPRPEISGWKLNRRIWPTLFFHFFLSSNNLVLLGIESI